VTEAGAASGDATDLAGLRVALVHDWLTGMRGGERVLEALCELFPRAHLFTLLHAPGAVSATIASLPRTSSFVERLPRAIRWYRHYLPLFPAAVEQFDLDGFDLVISSSHCAVKSVVATGRARHLCYCHSPMRYAWDQFNAYFGPDRLGRASGAARAVLRRLAAWDRDTSGRPDRYLANSQYVAQRIRRYYNRRAVVVPPPVDTSFYTPNPANPYSADPCSADTALPGSPDIAADRYFLVVSALVPYKRIELAIEASRQVNVPLKVVGEGTELERLRSIAGPAVEFLGRRTDEEVRDLYRGALAVLLPGEEDFGIVPVEAQACGRPVVALGRGGALETVVDGVTGVLAPDARPASWAAALDRVASNPSAFDADTIRANALRFSREQFMRAFLNEARALVHARPEAARW
jgi:glycosyltransferase involved in cell wall biosynthesis